MFRHFQPVSNPMNQDTHAKNCVDRLLFLDLIKLVYRRMNFCLLLISRHIPCEEMNLVHSCPCTNEDWDNAQIRDSLQAFLVKRNKYRRTC